MVSGYEFASTKLAVFLSGRQIKFLKSQGTEFFHGLWENHSVPQGHSESALTSFWASPVVSLRQITQDSFSSGDLLPDTNLDLEIERQIKIDA